MLLLVVGGGFVGTVTAIVWAELGHEVLLFEQDEDRCRALASGRPYFSEPGVRRALERRLQEGRLQVLPGERLAQACAERTADAAFVCVGTPRAPDGAADLAALRTAVRTVAPYTRILCVKSTVPPGTLDQVVAPLVPGRMLASTPEFLAEGQALQDARAPDRIVIGTHSQEAAQVLEALHAPLGGTVLRTTPRSAEMAKYASNAMLAARVGVVNELADAADRFGASLTDVMHVVGLDPRIGDRFLQAGLGFGGSCFPKDVAALTTQARDKGLPMPVLETVLQQNERRPERIAQWIDDALEGVAGARISVLGVAFKPNTSDIRESKAEALALALAARGADVVTWDPHAKSALPQADSVQAAVAGADAAVIATPWDLLLRQDWGMLLSAMRRPFIFDPWRRLAHPALADAHYHALGEPPDESRHTRSRPWHQVPALHKERA